MAGRLEGKISVITGAGSGMGRAMAEMFAGEGATVICADMSGQQHTVAETIGGAAIAVHADVTNLGDVQQMITTVEERFGRLDILVNNAGWGGPAGDIFHETSDADFEKLVAVNFRGVFYCMRAGIVSMLRTGGGSIVNISSASGLTGWRGIACYSGTKAGVVQMTKSAALEYAEQGIRINTVCPGTIWTGMVPHSAGSRIPPPGTAAVPNIPMNRWGLDKEIAATALFLASDEATYITGAAVPVDGGYVAG